ncbi:MAG: hypothetical protein NUV55_07640 [Sulfuricaulis sp.]|uniref:hypothetical protein n=1 Tax=Sulfuricaulis sp. TaxID=2003553 RepID=UPI0025E3F260|nr:hypothetical protein [Sulfuricaulis sp.]MCR4347057.1 hypothetical protein [Sulfuricaulis sp.]
MPEQTYQRVDLAKEQLEVALEMFLKRGSFVSALTLAGAAEEILGETLIQRGEKTTLQHECSLIKPVEDLFRKKPYSWSEFTEKKNRVRNAAKHIKNASEATVTADIEDEALWMIVRACDNHARLGLEPTPLMQEFEEWFYKNVVGLEYEV